MGGDFKFTYNGVAPVVGGLMLSRAVSTAYVNWNEIGSDLSGQTEEKHDTRCCQTQDSRPSVLGLLTCRLAEKTELICEFLQVPCCDARGVLIRP